MVIIWLSMVNNNLVGGIPTPLEKYEFVNEKDDIQYMKWKNNPNVPNHQPDLISQWVYTSQWVCESLSK